MSDEIIGGFLTTALSYYEAGSVSFEITGMIAEGERVALEWTSRARTRDGQPYENECIAVFQCQRRTHRQRSRVHGHAIRARDGFGDIVVD